MSYIYSFDSDIFINISRNYPRTIEQNQNIWDLLERRLTSGRIIVSREVIEEIKRGTDELYNWLKKFSGAIIESSETIQDRVIEIINNRFPGWINPDSTEHLADPFVIAVAMENKNGCVVTNEKRNRFLAENPDQWLNQPHSMKIPNICDAMNIRVVDFVLYLVETGNN